MYRSAQVIAGAGILLGIMLIANVSPANASDRFDVSISYANHPRDCYLYSIIPGQPRKLSALYRRSITYQDIKEPDSDYIVVSLVSGGNETGQSFQGIFEDADDADGKPVVRQALLKTRNASIRVFVRVTEVD